MKISKGTIVRTIMLVIVIINMILKACGKNIINIDENQVLTVLEYIIEIAVIAVNWWKNNSFTDKAIKADEFLKTLKESE